MNGKIQYDKEHLGEEAVPGGIGERIAYLRRRGDMTQAQLAEKLGISAQAVSKWEGGLSCPDIMMLVPLAQLFGISTDALLSGDGLMVDLKKPQEAEVKDEDDCDEWRQWGTKGQDFAPAEKIETLRVDLGACQVFIRAGDTFSVKFVGYRQEETRSEVKDGQWRISDRWKLVLFSGFRNVFSSRRVVITVPKGFHFREVRLNVGAGTLTGEGLISDICKLEVGAGEMTLVDFHSRDAKIDCGMGQIKLNGSLGGRCRMECGMGSIQADLKPMQDLGYDMSCGMGEIQFGSNHFGGFGGEQKMNPDARNFFRMNCGMGSIKVNFSENV